MFWSVYSPLKASIRWPCGSVHNRTLFSLPNLSPWGQETQTYHEHKILPYEQKELYEVVADVASYHHFIPFCTGSRIVRPPPRTLGHDINPKTSVMEAELTVGFLAFHEKYVSQVTCIPYQSVEAVASSSTPLFKTLSTKWSFQPASARLPQSLLQATLVTLDLAYAFANPLHASVSSAFFGQVSKLMVKAFEERCREVYGNRST